MGAPKTPKINELEYNGRTSNKKDAGENFICPRIKGAPFIQYFRVYCLYIYYVVRQKHNLHVYGKS